MESGPPAGRRPGVDGPPTRGGTGLDQAGRDLTGNPDVVVRDVELVASGWHVLRRTTFDYRHGDGRWTREHRETHGRGAGGGPGGSSTRATAATAPRSCCTAPHGGRSCSPASSTSRSTSTAPP